MGTRQDRELFDGGEGDEGDEELEELDELDTVDDEGEDESEGPRSVLLVEDDDDLRAMLTAELEDEGYIVRAATNRDEWLQELSAIRDGVSDGVSVQIVDIEMEEVDGLTALNEVRADGFVEPIIALVEGVGADGFDDLEDVQLVRKPVDVEAIADLVAELAAR